MTSRGPRPRFRMAKARAAAVAILTLPGARLLHEGQFEGRKVRLPVFLGRRPAEPVDQDLAAFYEKLLQETGRDLFRNGDWRLCERSGWPDNQSCRNILTWCWVKDDERSLVIVNFSDVTSQALVRVPWDELRDRMWRLDDRLSGESFERSGFDMRDAGLYVELQPWQCCLYTGAGSVSIVKFMNDAGIDIINVRQDVSGTSGRRLGDYVLFGVTAAEMALLFFLTPTFTAVDGIYVLQHLLVLWFALTRISAGGAGLLILLQRRCRHSVCVSVCPGALSPLGARRLPRRLRVGWSSFPLRRV